MAVWISTRPEVHSYLIDSDVQECHITLAYAGDSEFDSLRDKLRNHAKTRIIECEIRGIGTWVVPGKGHVLYASVFDTDYALLGWHFALRALIRMSGGIPDNSFPFNPHITLGWSKEHFTALPVVNEPIPITLNNLYISDDNYHEEVWSL